MTTNPTTPMSNDESPLNLPPTEDVAARLEQNPALVEKMAKRAHELANAGTLPPMSNGETPTPRTDDELLKDGHGKPLAGVNVVLASFARQLERELHAKDTEIARLTTALNKWSNEEILWNTERQKVTAEIGALLIKQQEDLKIITGLQVQLHESQAANAQMREALGRISSKVTRLNRDDLLSQIYEIRDVIKQALSLTSGKDLLERMKKMEEALNELNEELERAAVHHVNNEKHCNYCGGNLYRKGHRQGCRFYKSV